MRSLSRFDDQYAILDECTSAVTLEIEKVMYEHATGKFVCAMPFEEFDVSLPTY